MAWLEPMGERDTLGAGACPWWLPTTDSMTAGGRFENPGLTPPNAEPRWQAPAPGGDDAPPPLWS